MFDRISPVYDAMNRTMTLGLDQRWRRATVAAVVRPGDKVLDACCGTGDLAVAALHAGATVTGLDFSERMLERARAKSTEVEWVQGDAQAAAVRGRELRHRHRRLRRAQPRRPRARPRRAAAGAAARRPRCDPRDHEAERRCSRRSTGSGSTASCRSSGRSFPEAPPTRTFPLACAAFRPRRARGPSCAGAGFEDVSLAHTSRAGSSPCTSESQK